MSVSCRVHAPFMSPDRLASLLETDSVAVVDGTYFAASDGVDARQAFADGHLPGARFFDIERYASSTSTLPHMLPDSREFERIVSQLGIRHDQTVVVYDQAQLRGAPRVWWTFRRFGHANVTVLDGGLTQWRSLGLPLESGVRDHAPSTFVARPNDALVRTLDDALENARTRHELYIDGRSADRFSGAQVDGWTSRRGHMRGSVNLPVSELRRPDGRLRDTASLHERFAPFLDGRQIVATCGSGIAATLIALALETIGYRDVPVFDGSWAEWGRNPVTEALTDVA